MISETPPYGEKFGKSVKHILQREEQWNLWKNQGCPSLTPKHPEADKKEEESKESNAPSLPSMVTLACNRLGNPYTHNFPSIAETGTTRKRKMKLGDQVEHAMKQGKFLMGNQNLTKLWNKCPDNMEACSAPERDFLPNMDEYFAEAVEQLDPASGVEEEYKKVNDGQWGWRALRLLAKKSPHFFTYGNIPIAKLPDYLDSLLKKMYNISSSANASSSASTNGTKEANGSKESISALVCTKPQLEKLAANLGDKWSKLLPKLGLDADEKKKFEEQGKDQQGKTTNAAAEMYMRDAFNFFRTSTAHVDKMVRNGGRRCDPRRNHLCSRRSQDEGRPCRCFFVILEWHLK